MRLAATRASVTSAASGDTEPAVLWTPAELDSNLKLWLDASDLTTLTVSGSNVTQWDDKSGTGNHLVQATAANQFTTGTRTLNSLNVLEATASKTMQVSYNFGDQNTAPTFILGVVGFDTTGSNVNIVDGSSSNRILIRRRSSNKLGLYAGTFLDSSETLGAENILFAAKSNAASSEISINGQAPATGNAGTNSGLTTKIVLQHSDGIWGELLVYSGAMSTSDQEKTKGYLAHKWGLASGLPSDYLYKGSAPTL